jgi:flagellar protein FliO/FliZ
MARTVSYLINALVLVAGQLALAADHGQPSGSAAAKLPFQLVVARQAEAEADTPAATAEKPLPLAPPRRTAASSSPRERRTPTPANALSTVISSLAVVLGLFALVAWFTRRARPRSKVALPGEVVETLGRAPLNARQEMHLVRVGNKLLLLSVTATDAETLTEITDPDEIDRLTHLCRQHQTNGIANSFHELFSHLSNRPSPAARI